MSATLPPGWTGRDDLHRIRFGHIGIDVFSVGDGSFLWTIWTARGLRVVREGGDDESLSAPLARRAALDVLIALLTTARAEAETALVNLTDTEQP